MKIAPEGWSPAALIAVLAIAVGFLLHVLAAVPFVLLLLFTLWFFRDPERETPDDARALISPADGRILIASESKISIFMNVFDVHVCRSPMAGRIEEVQHFSGTFLAAYKDSASEHNERASIRVREGKSELTFTLVAGLVARRIVCRVVPGQLLRAGERVGLIRFGSRVDVTPPPGFVPQVRVGERVTAGETVIARAETLAPGEPTSI
jgi:phosphatidylserine decarboxylase